jgi:hypothetical protein
LTAINRGHILSIAVARKQIVFSPLSEGWNMNSKSKRVTNVIALVLSFAMAHVYTGVSFAQTRVAAGPNDNFTTAAQQTTGVVSIPSGKAITINGASAISGATIVSGASIETPGAVGATVSLGNLGSLEIEPGAKLSLEFQDGSIKVMLLQGCVTLHTNAGTAGEIDSPKGVIGKTDPKADGVIRTCNTEGGAVLTAPASVGATGGGLFGAGVLADIATLAGFGIIVSSPFIFGNRNPSPAIPNS